MRRHGRTKTISLVGRPLLVAALAWCAGGCIWMVPAYWDFPRDVTNDPAYWKEYRPGGVYQLKRDVAYGDGRLSDWGWGIGADVDELGRYPIKDSDVEGVMAAGTRLRVEKLVHHTGEGERTDAYARVVDGPLKGRRFHMDLVTPDVVERVGSGD